MKSESESPETDHLRHLCELSYVIAYEEGWPPFDDYGVFEFAAELEAENNALRRKLGMPKFKLKDQFKRFYEQRGQWWRRRRDEITIEVSSQWTEQTMGESGSPGGPKAGHGTGSTLDPSTP